MFSPPAPAICGECLPSKLIRRNDENTVRLRVSHVDDLQVSPSSRLTDRHTGAITGRPILASIRYDLLHLVLINLVIPNMRLTCCWIEVEA